MSKNVSVYFCGGTGANGYKRTKDHISEQVNMFVVDTSEANLRKTQIDSGSIYLFDGLDGSGKKRDMNYIAISDKIDEVIFNFKPSDLNIVYHSGAGGSGSVIGPILVNKLLQEDKVVVVCLVGSSDSMKEIENTYKTIESYKAISSKNEKPVVIYYDEINKDKTRTQVDTHMDVFLSILITYYDKNKVHQLDTADMMNFINFNKVTPFKPSIATIDVFGKSDNISKGEILVAAATLTTADESYSVNSPVPYQTVGIIENDDVFRHVGGLPIHMFITKGKLEQVTERLSKDTQQHEQYLKTIKDITHDNHDTGNKDNLVL